MKHCALAAFLSFCAFGCTSAPPTPNQLNILWISVEDMSPRLGCYGDALARTPNLDRLAGEGLRYSSAFTTAGVCAPSRAAIITGMFQPSIGAHHMRTTHEAPGLPTPYHTVPPPHVKTFTEYLRAAGYYCTNNVKTDYQVGEPVTAWDESSSQAHWRNRGPGQPFFAVFNFTTTHESQVWPKPDQELVTDPSRVALPPYYPDTPAVREDLARHYDNIAAMDQQVGAILGQLEADGLADDTVVFFWSDHGDGLPRAKRWLYDSGIHVPLIIRWPGALEPGSTTDRLVSLMDLGPTVLSIAGVEVPGHVQGRAFLGSGEAESRHYVFGARDRIDQSYDFVRAVRDGRYKFIRNYYPERPYILPVPYRDRGVTMQEILRLRDESGLQGPQLLWVQPTRPPEELYDTLEDPWEINNLIAEPPMAETAERLRRTLLGYLEEVGDLGSLPEAEMVARMWPGMEQPKTDQPIVNPYGGRFDGLVEVTLGCATEGASIAYSTLAGESPKWLLYSGPIQLTQSGILRAVAIRYGYAHSDEIVLEFRIGD